MTNIHNILAARLPEINEELKVINHGGCGRFALELHKALKRRSILSGIVLVYADGNADIGTMNSFIAKYGKDINSAYINMFNSHKAKDEYPHILNDHVCLDVGGVLYDSTGVTEYKAIGEALTVDTMHVMLKCSRVWNSEFRIVNRRKTPPKVMVEFFNRILPSVKTCREVLL